MARKLCVVHKQQSVNTSGRSIIFIGKTQFLFLYICSRSLSAQQVILYWGDFLVTRCYCYKTISIIAYRMIHNKSLCFATSDLKVVFGLLVRHTVKAAVCTREYVMLCAIWYHLYNLENVKNPRGRMLLLVKLVANIFATTVKENGVCEVKIMNTCYTVF